MDNPDVDSFLHLLGLRKRRDNSKEQQHPLIYLDSDSSVRSENEESIYRDDILLSSDQISSSPTAEQADEIINKLMNFTLQCLGTIRLLIIEQNKIEQAKSCTKTEYFQSPGSFNPIKDNSKIKNSKKNKVISSYINTKKIMIETFSDAVNSMVEGILYGEEYDKLDPRRSLYGSFPWEQSIQSSGWCMLHWAAWNAQSNIKIKTSTNHKDEMNKISQLVTIFPKAKEELDINGHTFLYYAISGNNLPIIKSLTSLSPDITRCKDGNDKTVLHYGCTHSDKLEIFSYLLSLFPDNEYVYKYCVDDNGNMLIHAAAEGRSSLEVVRELLFLFPDSPKLFNADGMLPLHLAMKNTNVDVIQSIFSAYPEAITQVDVNGWLPIHHAAYFNSTVHVLQWLYKTYPIGFSTPQRPSGRLPLQYAAAKCLSLSTVRFIYEVYPEAISIFDTNRRLPLHTVLARSNGYMNTVRLECFKILLHAYPQAINMRGQDERTPFDLAKRDNLGDLVYYMILKINPELDPELFESLSEKN